MWIIYLGFIKKYLDQNLTNKKFENNRKTKTNLQLLFKTF